MWTRWPTIRSKSGYGPSCAAGTGRRPTRWCGRTTTGFTPISGGRWASFIAALQSLSSYDRHKSAFRTWLYHIASHKIIDHRRRYRAAVPLTEDIPSPEDLTAIVHDKVLSAQAEALVRQEEPLDQEIFRLHVYGQCSFPQIAAVTGQAEAKIKSRYYRLIARLRKELTDDE